MKRFLSIIVVGLAFSGLFAQTGDAPEHDTAKGFAKYELIIQRNPFNPNRRPDRREEDNTERPPEPPRTEHIRLVGTWVTNEGRLAFMEGGGISSSTGKEVGEEIDGWTIDSIATDKVEISKDAEKIEWRVGSEIARQGDEEWHLTETTSGDLPEVSDEATENILERLRAKRRKENGS